MHQADIGGVVEAVAVADIADDAGEGLSRAIGQPTFARIGVCTAANPFFISPTGAASQMVGYSFVRDLGNPRQSLGSESFGVTAGASYDLGAHAPSAYLDRRG